MKEHKAPYKITKERLEKAQKRLMVPFGLTTKNNMLRYLKHIKI